MELSIYLKPYVYLYNYKTETAIFIATKHWKNNYDSYLKWYKYVFPFELLASEQYYKNETGKKFSPNRLKCTDKIASGVLLFTYITNFKM